jgi:type I restriction enzyme S subunit
LPEYRGLPHVSGENIESGSGRLLPVRSAAEDRVSSGNYLFDPGVVLYSKLRPYLRKVAVADFRGVCSADMYPVRFNADRVHTEFAKFALLTEEFTRYAIRESERARMPKLNREQLLRYEIPLPPIAVQVRIARQLTEKKAGVDRALAAAESRLAAAEALASAYLREVFEGTEAAEWPRLPIGMLGDPNRGDVVQTGPFGAQLPSSEFRSSGVPVLNIGNVKDGKLLLQRLDYVSSEKAAALDRYRLRPGDMLFTRSGSVGRSAVVTDECDGWLMSYHLLRVAFDAHRAEPRFVSAAVRGDPLVLRQIRSASGRGATRDGVNAKILANLVVPVPELREQRRVLAELSRRLAEAERLTALVRQELAAIDALPTAFLRQAFNGDR